MVDGTEATRLFRRHVVRSPEDGPGLRAARQPLVAWRSFDFRDSEVENFGDLVVVVRRSNEKDILGFEIAMDDARVVRPLQRTAYLTDDAGRVWK